jgi:hypothetical protein
MAHEEQQNFVKRLKLSYPNYFKDVKVLDIGSLDINGTLKVFFEDSEYTGVDIEKGPNVDVVCKGHEYKGDKYHVVCSGECFEHDEYYELSLKNMYDHLIPNGLMFFTCATTGRPEHGTSRSEGGLWGTSPEYYKNITIDDVREALDVDTMFSSYSFGINKISDDLYFYGFKITLNKPLSVREKRRKRRLRKIRKHKMRKRNKANK